MVALKARIEGAGFALPARTLAKFLLACAKTDGANGAIQRLWTDAAGARSIEAVYLGLDQDVVRLRKTDGKEFSIAVKKLGEADQEFIRILAAVATGSPSSAA